jgi:hypothetical protein
LVIAFEEDGNQGEGLDEDRQLGLREPLPECTEGHDEVVYRQLKMYRKKKLDDLDAELISQVEDMMRL